MSTQSLSTDESLLKGKQHAHPQTVWVHGVLRRSLKQAISSWAMGWMVNAFNVIRVKCVVVLSVTMRYVCMGWYTLMHAYGWHWVLVPVYMLICIDSLFKCGLCWKIWWVICKTEHDRWGEMSVISAFLGKVRLKYSIRKIRNWKTFLKVLMFQHSRETVNLEDMVWQPCQGG